MTSPHHIDQIRRFNRLITLKAGALDASYLGRGRPLGQARLLFEIGPKGADLQALREKLGLDSGHMSRLLKALSVQGLVTIATDPSDRRRRTIELSPKGRQEFEAYDSLSNDLAISIADALSPIQQERLFAAMAEVESLLNIASISLATEPADSEDARSCLAAYFAELSERFKSSFDPGSTDMSEDGSILILARSANKPVGCGVLRPLGPGVGEIKRMWVAPSARGTGLARRLLSALEAEAASRGLDAVRLDTNGALVEALNLYRSAGYRDIDRYNDNPYADFWFEKQLGPTGA
jgi:DNA-binding MarR family transcriptional regulator/predicted N-acetyltransferase YhbS